MLPMSVRNLILVLAAAAGLAAQTGDVDVLLQRAIRKESVEGDLNGAIDLYKKVVAAAGKNRAAAARALLGLGESYEKQGNAEAQKSYERLVREFPDQAEPSREARLRLARLQPAPAGDRSITAQRIAQGFEADLQGRVTADGKLYTYVDQDSGNIAVRNLQTGVIRQLTKDATGIHHAHGHLAIPSRDGKQVAYMWYLATHPSLSELRVINMNGTGQQTVPFPIKTRDEYQVVDWFPDGKSIVVYGGRDQQPNGFATIDLATGTERRMNQTFLSGGSRSLSADGRWILYSKPQVAHNSAWDLYALNTQTGQETALMQGPASDRNPMWVPDSEKFIFVSDRGGKDGIWMARFKDGKVVGASSLVKPEAGDFLPLSITRQGSVYYGISHRSSDVYQAMLDPQSLRMVSAPTKAVESYLGHNTAPAWSPSGGSFAYYSERDLTRIYRLVVRGVDGKETALPEPVAHPENPPQWCGGDLVRADAGRAIIFRLVDILRGESQPDLTIKRPGASFQLGLSRDCRSVYVSSLKPDTKQRRIYRYDFSTGSETDLLIDGGPWAVRPTVSPDGRWLALLGELEGGNQRGIMVLPTSGGALRMLTTEDPSAPSWAPDSKHLLYTQNVRRSDGQGTENEIYTVSVDGGSPQSTGVRMPGAAAPSLNADGKRLLVSTTSTSNELWVLRNLPLN